MTPDTVYSPRVLKDGSDSVGALGALNRVYLNIGLFSEEWLLHFNPLIGGKKITPIEIAVARKNSAYWEATEAQTPDMALFFLKSTAPHKLKDAPGGDAYLSKDQRCLTAAKMVFAERCARCHSSKLPTPAEGLDPGGCSGKDYLTCWNKYWAWTKTDDFKSQDAGDRACSPTSWTTTSFPPSSAFRSPCCKPMPAARSRPTRSRTTSGITSLPQTYKDLPSVGAITVYNPMTGEPSQYKMPPAAAATRARRR